MKQYRNIFIGLLLFVCVGTLWANDPDGNTYPTPERLFYITRSLNKNLVCYDLNLVNGQLDTEKPLHVYWINREEHPGKKDELNFIQRKMAYGYKLVRKEADQSVVTLTAYPGRELMIRAHAGTQIIENALLIFPPQSLLGIEKMHYLCRTAVFRSVACLYRQEERPGNTGHHIS